MTAPKGKPASSTDAETDGTGPSRDPAAGRAKKKTAGARRRKTGEKRQRLNEALIVELRSLRADIAQTAEAFALRAGGRVAEMLQILEGDESLEIAPRRLTVAEAEAVLDELAADPTGPIEGRMREIRRIQRIVRDLRRRIHG
jgi:hypothetical protein